MKKFTLTIGSATREVNANEYSVFPKANLFKAMVNGVECDAATTSGKGKSAVNNHYVYFREGATIFYVKSDASEVVEARKGFSVTSVGAPAIPPEVAEKLTKALEEKPAEMKELMAALAAPVSKRKRVAKPAA